MNTKAAYAFVVLQLIAHWETVTKLALVEGPEKTEIPPLEWGGVGRN